MEWYCVVLETIVHPGTREVLLHEGEVCQLDVIRNICDDTGMDNVKVQLCDGLPAAWVMQAQLYHK